MALFELAGARCKTTDLFPYFAHFAAERQRAFLRRASGEVPPWSANPHLSGKTFCNVYRAVDANSQFLINRVLYDQTERDKADHAFRACLFRIFNRPDVWLRLGSPSLRQSDVFGRVYKELAVLVSQDRPVYRGVYRMSIPKECETVLDGVMHWVTTLEAMAADGTFAAAAAAESLFDLSCVYERVPHVGRFMSAQLAYDTNYAPGYELDEDWADVAPGAGSDRGLGLAFSDLGGLNQTEAVQALARQWAEVTERSGFDPLFHRWPTPVDVEHTLCEFSKYCAQTAQNYSPGRAARPQPLGFPPSWGMAPFDAGDPARWTPDADPCSPSPESALRPPPTRYARAADYEVRPDSETTAISVAGTRVLATPVLGHFLDFCAEMSRMMYRSWAGPREAEQSTLTDNPLLGMYSYGTTPYRAAKENILLTDWLYDGDWSEETQVFRGCLARSFYRYDTLAYLEVECGLALTHEEYDAGAACEALGAYIARGDSCFTADYRTRMPPLSEHEPQPRAAYSAWCWAVHEMRESGLMRRATAAKTLEGLYSTFLAEAGLGPFLAYQYACDVNYAPAFQFAEDAFVGVSASLGSDRMLAEIFASPGGLSSPQLVVALAADWERLADAHGVMPLFGRHMTAVDLEDALCAFAHYLDHVRGRTRQAPETDTVNNAPIGFPPSWGLPFDASAPQWPEPESLPEVPDAPEGARLPVLPVTPLPDHSAKDAAADAVAELGCAVLPVRFVARGTKIEKPPVPGCMWRDPGHAHTDAEWAKAEGYGIILEGMTVVDFDTREALKQFEPLIEACDTLSVITMRGMHLYFSGETRVLSGPGFDVKSGAGHYTVGPGSQPKTMPGQGYKRHTPWNLEPAPAPAARALLAALEAAATDKPEAAPHEGGVRELGTGGRNSGLASLAGSMQGAGLDDENIRAALHRHNSEHCKPPLSAREVDQIADSILRYEKGQPVPAVGVAPDGNGHSMACRVCKQPVEACPGCGRHHADRRDWLAVLQPVPASVLRDLPPPSWVVEPLWPDDGTTILYGPTGTFKTFVALDWALRAAAGQGISAPMPAGDGRVLYLAGEGKSTLSERIDNSTLGGWADQVDFIVESLPLLGDREAESALQSVITDNGYKAVVMDTLQTFKTSGFEEDSADKMAALFKALADLPVPVLLVMHSGKDQTRGPRGSSAFMTDSSAVWRARRTSGPGVDLLCEKMRQQEPQSYHSDIVQASDRMVRLAGYKHTSEDAPDGDTMLRDTAMALLEHGRVYTNKDLSEILGEAERTRPGMRLARMGIVERANEPPHEAAYRLVV